MASWNDIFESIQSLNALEKIKKEFFDEYYKYTNRNLIVYFSCWQQKVGIRGAYSIDDDDRNGFMNCIYKLDKTKGLDILLHTPGGDLAATQSIVEYLYKIFNGDIRVIVPHIAMSAGTMIACSSKEIIMGAHSNLGPIDPQIMDMPAHEFLKLLDQAQQDLQINKNILYWKDVLSKYPPTFFGLCKNAIDVSKKIIKGWLERCMLASDTPENVDKTVDFLSNYNLHLQHNSRLHIDYLKANTSLKITELENDNELQELVMSIYHCFQILSSMSPASKIIENHNQIKFIKNISVSNK